MNKINDEWNYSVAFHDLSILNHCRVGPWFESKSYSCNKTIRLFCKWSEWCAISDCRCARRTRSLGFCFLEEPFLCVSVSQKNPFFVFLFLRRTVSFFVYGPQNSFYVFLVLRITLFVFLVLRRTVCVSGARNNPFSLRFAGLMAATLYAHCKSHACF